MWPNTCRSGRADCVSVPFVASWAARRSASCRPHTKTMCCHICTAMLFLVPTLLGSHELSAISPPPKDRARQFEPSVHVGGGVRHPGRYDWCEGMTVLEAISAAGGFTDSAGRRVSIVHTNGLSEFYTRSGTNTPPILRPRDRVSVPKYTPRKLF